ncbi:SPRY domain-containing SOCS box protein 3-like isoform X2 [Physella acuta]|uniref:SPRY domain-containing SOCS box protein 3-like isoform X2 n=1 Tax=Physella acuta TaxID=109671 RepID=UPI0027DC6D4B|nr:SPRY domain-containing SOCS box protein 3-like isoform X2 [Physella acuta]
MKIIGSNQPAIREYFNESWVWDSNSKPPEVQLSSNMEAAYFYIDPVIQSTGTVGVRGTKGFSDGEHYWEIVFLEPPRGTSVMVGVGTCRALLRSNLYQYINLIGQDEESWGLSYKGCIWHNGISKRYCDPFFDSSTVIGVLLDMYKGTLTFYKNGISLGEAFTGLNAVQKPLYPLISSTATETELELGVRTCRYLTLQEKCFSKIRSSLVNMDSVDKLPIPKLMKNHIRDL